MKRIHAYCLVLVCLCCPAFADLASEIRIPDLPTADMRLSWQDFRELLKLIQPDQQPAATEKKKKPPTPWAFLDCVYQADATRDGEVRVDAVITLQVWEDDWVEIPVLGKGVALESATLDGESSFLTQKEDWYNLMLDQPGVHTLALTFYVASESNEGVVAFTFPAPATPVTRMTLQLALPEAQISSPVAASVQSRKTKDGLEADLVFRSAESIAVQWRLPAKALPPKPKVAAEPPRVACFSSTLATVSENHLACETLLQLNVLRGEVTRFLLRLPGDIQVMNVEGKGAEWTAKEEDGQQWITVSVNHSVTGDYPLGILYETPIPEGAANVSVPTLRVEEVLRNTGFIAIATRGNIEVEPLAENEGVQRVDVSDLPVALQVRSPTPIVHAFRFTQPDYLLALNYSRLEDVPVRVAGIDHARITSVLTDEGMLLTRATYFVRNHMKKFMRIELAPDAEVWGAQVAGQVVRPARSDDAGDEVNAILVPLIKSTEGRREMGAFSVDVVYAQQLADTHRWLESMAFEAPKTDILANRVEWEILVPEARAVYRTGGDLNPVARLSPIQVNQPGGKIPIEKGVAKLAPDGESTETIYRLREGIERFFITDINNPAASVGGTGEPRYDGKQDPDAPHRALPGTGSALTVAGVLPIRIEIPRAGHAHYFERLVVPQDTALSVQLDSYDARLRLQAARATGAAIMLAGLMAALLLWRLRTRQTDPRHTAVMLVAFFVLLTPAAYFGLITWKALALKWLIGMLLGGVVVLLRGAMHNGMREAV